MTEQGLRRSLVPEKLTTWISSPVLRLALVVTTAGAAAVGSSFTAYWLFKALELAAFDFLLANLPPLGLGLGTTAALTLVNIALRWVRWHFLIRRVGARVAAKDSLLIYAATTPSIITPFYVGELIRVVLLGTRYSRYRFDVAAIWLMERSSDLMALCLFLGLTQGNFAYLGLSGLLWLSLVLLLRMIYRHVRSFEFPQPFTLVVLVVGSLVVSTLAPSALWAITLWLDHPVGLASAFDVFASSAIFGYLTGLPSGIGLTGSAMVLGLESRGLGLLEATSSTFIFRVGTVWFGVSLGIVVFVVFRRRLLEILREGRVSDHFDEIAEQYDQQLPSWIRNRVLARKIQLMHADLARDQLMHADLARDLTQGSGDAATDGANPPPDGANPPAPEGANPPPDGVTLPQDRSATHRRGLDIGCGQGWHALEMAQLGYRMTGVDQSQQQVSIAAQHALERGVAVMFRAGDASRLPFADSQFDFAYAINMFHHLIDDEARDRSFKEVIRVLRPGGVFFLHEINTINVLFRLYMGYLFPLIRGIDEGTEKWLRPDNLPQLPGASWSPQIDYFTFLPDFAPLWLLQLLGGVERLLERSRFKRWSAHYTARLVKTSDGTDG